MSMIREECVQVGGVYFYWIDRTDFVAAFIIPFIVLLGTIYMIAGYRSEWFFGKRVVVGYYDDHPGDQICRP